MDLEKQEQIKKQAKQILDNFASALASVEKKAKKEEGVERDEFEREEGQEKECDSEFKKAFLKNAPEHDDDFIIAEKGDWKQNVNK
jgi:predicted Asp-tRNA(Asn)/Glu-tRNA(Gln) amidotransferase subunit C